MSDQHKHIEAAAEDAELLHRLIAALNSAISKADDEDRHAICIDLVDAAQTVAAGLCRKLEEVA